MQTADDDADECRRLLAVKLTIANISHQKENLVLESQQGSEYRRIVQQRHMEHVANVTSCTLPVEQLLMWIRPVLA
jgi:outer membrane biogenesis lipoprotein LolB